MSAVRKKKRTEPKKRASSHSVRFNDCVWEKWNSLKDDSNYTNHNDFALALLDRWEGVVAQPEPESEPRETPQKSLLPTVLFSTPGTSGITRPAIEASDISGVSESEQSESARSEDSLVKNYQKKAQDADSSFIEITFEVSASAK